MNAPVEGGKLFAIPYFWNVGSPEKNTVLLDHLCEHPMWFTTDMTAEEIRVACAWMLTNGEFWKWEVWLGGRMVGMLVVHDITPRLDCTFHFTFFGVSLLAARRLLQNFLGHIFEQFEVQRISMEVPEHVKGLERFARQKLGFRYEGELNCREHPTVQFLSSRDAGRFHAAEAHTWIARQGSRREAAHWDATAQKYRDVVLLRLLRTEYYQQTPRDEHRAASEPVEDRYAAQVEEG